MKKLEALTDAVFYAQQDPKKLATILADIISDVVTSVAVFGAVEIVLDTESGSTAEYTGKALSQFGDEMDETVTLALKEAVTGVSISDGTVTVDKTVADGTTFVIEGTCGSVTGELTVTVKVEN